VRPIAPCERVSLKLILLEILLALLLLLQTSRGQWLFPNGGAPNLLLAAVLVISMRFGLTAGVLTGAWGGLLSGALSGAGWPALAALYIVLGWCIGSLRELFGRPPFLEMLLLAAAASVMATLLEAACLGFSIYGLPALHSLAPQMLFLMCVIALDQLCLVLL
jgi:hypothetical protein